ncbi:heavy-metal-associated domain-containing protein [Pararhodospirillum oryzae]|uniref:HMA domain-containing protein n=1 Tax=Pararhodospirillum oryzae TaxID=478448 RepID=A0A512H867_9PROT|nr:heavy-metal-associated domain-containing protein [Pararhodospirillum oryzae]GEO81644.1 hypothetical protein ROR02_17750 [Pararhodospirillum oryzae]
MTEQIFSVEGMTCGGCVASVERAILRVVPQARVTVELDSGRVGVTPPGDALAICDAVEAAGFGCKAA